MTEKPMTNAVRAKAAMQALERRAGGIRLTRGQARTIVRSVRANGSSRPKTA